MHDRIDAAGRPLENTRRGTIPYRDGWIFEPLLRLEFAIAMPTLVASRDLVVDVGGFDERLHFGEFHDLCLRLALQSEVVALRESLCFIRVHDEHYSADRIGAQISWIALYEKMAELAPTRLYAPTPCKCAQKRR